MKNFMKGIIVMFIFASVFACKDIGGEKVLYGDWENRNTSTAEYSNKILRIEKKTDEMKKNKEEYDGTYKMAYVMGNAVVKDSIIEGKWVFRSSYNKDKAGYINAIEMTPNNKELRVQTYEFYFDGSMLNLIDRASNPPSIDSYYKVSGGLKDF